MVDLKRQYLRIKNEIDAAIDEVVVSGSYIQGSAVKSFEKNLAKFTGSKHVIGCANGTDALLAALMSCDVKSGDEVITTPFTFVSTVEVIVLLGAKPIFVDVCKDTFNIDSNLLEEKITEKTKAIIPVHLFGQCADMEEILRIAKKHNIKIIEDACQALGSVYTFSDGSSKQAGVMGDIGCTSFFPTKNLGCFGDGGAIMVQDDELAEKLRMICCHGSKEKYNHEIIGLNSRLDTLQAAILDVKLQYLNEYIAHRQKAADFYYNLLNNIKWLQLPVVFPKSTHTYHQFTIKIDSFMREDFQIH